MTVKPWACGWFGWLGSQLHLNGSSVLKTTISETDAEGHLNSPFLPQNLAQKAVPKSTSD